MDNLSVVKQNLRDAIALKQDLLQNDTFLTTIDKIANQIIQVYQKKGKVLFCGNGGSAADAQHLSSELSGRYYYDRPPLAAEALHVNTSHLTAVANDYSFAHVYARLVEGIGQQGDIIVGLSTSGNSENVINALQEARKKGMITIGFTGAGGGKLKAHCDFLLAVPSTDTPRIQECHLLIGHAICQIVEATLFPPST